MIIDNFIADLLCPKLKLEIELDGLEHLDMYNNLYDNARLGILERYGLIIMRITNKEISENFENSFMFIQKELKRRESELRY